MARSRYAPAKSWAEKRDEEDELLAAADGEQEEAKFCNIRYRVVCEDSYGPGFVCEQLDKPFDLKVTEKNVIVASKGPTPVIEIITSLDVATKFPKFKWGKYGMGKFGMGMGGARSTVGGRGNDDTRSAYQGSAFEGRFGGGGGGGFGMFPGMFPGGMMDDDETSEEESEVDENGEKKEKVKKPAPKPTLENKRINKIGPTRMVVHSPWLLDVLREVIQYYPSQNMTGDTITIHEPYHVFAHHITELRDFGNRLALERGTDSDSEEQDDAAIKHEHLKVLLEYLEPHIEKSVIPARRRLKKDVPTTVFNDIWYLLRPGALAYLKHDDIWLGCVVESVTLEDATDDEPGKWKATVWLLDHAWSSSRINKARLDTEITHFEGEKIVTDLNLFPREYLDQTDGGARRTAFEARGARCRDIVWAGHAYQLYDGRAMTDKKTYIKGPVVAETEEPWWVGREDNRWSLNWSWEDEVEGIVYEHNHLQKDLAPKIIRKLEFKAKDDKAELLTPDHLFLLCPVMVGFSLANKTWQPLNIDFMSEVPKPKFTPDANIAEENLNIIKALSYRQTKSKLSWSADFIKNKGDGVVCLLHGPAGTGKTFTVETTAIHTRRPLVALTIGDLGSNESSIEEELSRWFNLATRWRAVLLIDEADIFLEKRRVADLARNGVVTAFLRKMEYFGGLLFLTTNRVDSMDDAFMSRVHVVIGFEKLNDTTRVAIWRSFFEKLRREMTQIRVDEAAENYVLGHPEIVGMDWNGREIRNAFQTAIALAEYEASEKEGWTEADGLTVRAEHFKRVMEISKTFKSYVEKVKANTSAKDTDSEWADLN